MEIRCNNSKLSFSGLKFFDNSSSDIANSIIKRIKLHIDSGFELTGKPVLKNYRDPNTDYIPVNWQLYQTESLDSDVIAKTMICVFSLNTTKGRMGDTTGFVGAGKISDSCYAGLTIEGDMKEYTEKVKAATPLSDVYEIVDSKLRINIV